VPISGSVYGALTKNRSSLEPSRGFTAIIPHAVPLLLILRTGGGTGTTFTSGLMRHNLLGARAGSSGACRYRARSTMHGGRQSRLFQEKAQRLLRFWVKVPTPAPKSAQPSRAPARGRGVVSVVHGDSLKATFPLLQIDGLIVTVPIEFRAPNFVHSLVLGPTVVNRRPKSEIQVPQPLQ